MPVSVIRIANSRIADPGVTIWRPVRWCWLCQKFFNWLGECQWFVGLFLDGSKVQIELFKAQMRGAVQAHFNQDRVFGTDPDRLIHQDLEEVFLATHGVVIGQDALHAY